MTSGGDGIKASNTEDQSLGFVYIEGGNFDITSEGDGIQAETVFYAVDGDFNIVSGGGSANSTKVWHDVQKFKENGQYARCEEEFREELEVLGLSPVSGPVLPMLDSLDLLFGEDA